MGDPWTCERGWDGQMTGKGCVAYHDDSYREGTGTLRLAGD